MYAIVIFICSIISFGPEAFMTNKLFHYYADNIALMEIELVATDKIGFSNIHFNYNSNIFMI